MRALYQWSISFLFFLFVSSLTAQTWTEIDPKSIVLSGYRDIVPQTYMTYQMDYQEMKTLLWTSPHEYAQNPAGSNTIIMVGLADGSADMFRIVQYDMMEAPLAAQYTDIKTFRGISISNPYRTIRADWTKSGFRAVITDLEGKTFIDPFQRNDMSHRIVYYAKDYRRYSDWSCGVTDEQIQEGETPQQRTFGDCTFRSYRLAVATTGEYSNFFGATSPSQSGLVLSQVVTAINRINEVYESDITVRLVLVGNTTSVFYYDSGTDPYTNSNGSTMLGQNQTTIDAVIGSSNYDLGHVFSTGGGGVAYLGSICNASIKAGGVTGSSSPVGDPYVIDYVAHEMGHQLGGNHTFNGTIGSCGGGNRSASSAFEPGSGSTIMAYAGICGSQDIQPHSDDYFHARSLFEIGTKLVSTNCATMITLNNDAPVASGGADYTIPISTPFVLTASATDANNDPLSYCWEEYDLESTATDPPTANDPDGPMFRSFSPVAIPQRYFPRLADLTQNITPTWEVLPSVTRTMNYRLTVRDYHNIAGCADEDDVVVSTTATSGPFVVTSQNSVTSWFEGGTETITWNVANTTASPVSCTNVDIRLSMDGGMTYPIALSLNEPNDGSANILVPPGTTTTARIMVKGSNNIFFDINNTNITINSGLPNFTITLNPSTISECNDGTVETAVQVGQFMGFTDPVTLSILNLPPGATASFVPQVVNPGGSSTLTISNLTGLFGTYTPTVRGSSTTGNKDAPLVINLLAPLASGPTLTAPLNAAADVVITPLLDWQTLSGALQYEYQLAYDNGFNAIAKTGITIADSYQNTSPLIVGQIYYWRVRAINSCGNGSWSSVFSFTTVSCFALMSPNVPVTISATGTPTVTSTFTSTIDMVINDVNVIKLTGSHSWVQDLKFSLLAPDNTERLFWNQPCGNYDNFNINFDDDVAAGSWPCPPTDGLTYRPSNTLSFFDGKHSLGVWTLKIQDGADQDGGSLSTWGLKVCGDLGCQLVVNQTTGTGTGTLQGAISCAGIGDTVRLGAMLSGQTINVGNTPLTINKNIVILAEGPNINITGGGTRVFEIANGTQVEFIGMTITAGTSMVAGAINNPGIVKLKNITIHKNPAVMGASMIQNSPGAQLNVAGTCYIYQ